MDFHSPLSNEGVGEFVSRADPSFAATRQREEVGETEGIFVYLCVFNALSYLRDCHSASPIGMRK